MFKPITIRPETHKDYKEIISLVLRSFHPVSVHADYLRNAVLGIERVKEMGYKGILVEGDYHFYNKVGFITSSEYGIYPTSGYALTEPGCQMCMETYQGSLKDKTGYIIYDMYYNA